MADHPKISLKQKLTAISLKYYQNMEWVPQAGDYYTSVRADLVLSKITRIDGRRVFTINCNKPDPDEVEYDLAGFTSTGIGALRVHVPSFILDQP